MCEQCCADAEFFDECLPGWYLCRARKDGHYMEIGDFGLVRCNDPDFIFKIIPRPEPQRKLSKANKSLPPDMVKILLGWKKEVDTFDEQMKDTGADLYAVYELVAAAKEKGYDREKDGRFSCWLFNYLGEFLEDKI